MQFIRVFQYLGVITALISFIQQAQDAFRDRSGAGAEKKAQVLPQLTSLVQTLQQTGLIEPRVANAIINGAGVIIDAFVLVLKGAGLLRGGEEFEPGQGPGGDAVATEPTA